MGFPSRPGFVSSCEQRWQSRIERAPALAEQYPAAASALRFYEKILELQFEIARDSNLVFRSDIPLRKQIDRAVVCSKLPLILNVSVCFGPDLLKTEADVLDLAGEAKWRELVDSAIEGYLGLSAAEDFFTRACLQPVAENLQSQLPEVANYSGSICPACGGLPQMSVLRPESEGASRWLVCSFCLREWLFRRIVCPRCGQEDKEKLPHFSSEQCSYVHVEACNLCKHYLKAIDLTVNGHAVPLIDEAGLAVLDVWADGMGYTKIIRNLIGF